MDLYILPLDAAALAGLDAGEVNERLTLALQDTMDALAADAMSRDPARFLQLLDGRVGVGGVYDLWRRGRAWLEGRPFHAGHGAPDS